MLEESKVVRERESSEDRLSIDLKMMEKEVCDCDCLTV